MNRISIYIFLVLTSFGTLSFSQDENISQGQAFDGEPYLAVNPNNSQEIVVAWMGFALGQEIVIKSKSSINGGLTWGNEFIHDHVNAGNRSADPSIQFDNAGNVFLCFIDFDDANFTNGQVVVKKSTDIGINWGSPVEAISISDCPDKLCVDRPWMVIDRSGTSSDGTIYVTSMNADQSSIVDPPYNPYLSVSTDNGSTFETPRFLDTIDFLAGSVITKPMASPSVSSTGIFYAIYPSYETSQSFFAQAILATSTSQGVDIDHSVAFQSTSGLTNQLAKKAGKFLVDPSDENHLLSVYFTEDNGDMDLFTVESYDGGVNWTSAIRVNDDVIGNGVMQDMVWASFNEVGDIVVSWRDRRISNQSGYSNDSEIMGAVKRADSSSFSSNFAISSQSAQHEPVLEGSGNDFQCIEFVQDTLHAVWGDTRTGTLNIYYNKIVFDEFILSSGEELIVQEEYPQLLYPNPAVDWIIYPEEFIGATFTLLNSQGKVILKSMEKNNKIDVSILSKGKYYLVFQEVSKPKTFVFIK